MEELEYDSIGDIYTVNNQDISLLISFKAYFSLQDAAM